MVEYSIEGRPSYPVLRVRLRPGEQVDVESGAMMAMLGDVRVETRAMGGVISSLARRLMGGESFWVNTFYTRSRGEVMIAPPYPGDIEYIPLVGDEYVVQDTSFLACHGEVELGVAWRGLKGLLAEGELVWLRVRGRGGVWITAFGAITRLDVPLGEVATVDNFHFVAMPANMSWKVGKFGGLKSLMLGGEGIVFRVRGPGTVYLQTRVLPQFAELLSKFLPKRRK